MSDDYLIRPIRPDEWAAARAFRLAALADEATPIAFANSAARSVAGSESFWRRRARDSSFDAGSGATLRQFVAVTGDGTWAGTVTAQVERAGEDDIEGRTVARDGVIIVGVYVDPDHRGRGVIGRLFSAALAWTREIELDHVRLYVDDDNARARAAYTRLGFRPTGIAFSGPFGPELEMRHVPDPEQRLPADDTAGRSTRTRTPR